MLTLSLVILAFTVAVSAKKCFNASVPVTIKSRNAVFNSATLPQTKLDSTTFIQQLTQQGRNFTAASLTGYADVTGTYNISTQLCMPSSVDKAANPIIQVLTHGIGFDKSYWDNSFSNFNYSYVSVATDEYNYYTLAYDRLGIGQSSHGEPLNEIQAFLEIQALASLTNMLREGQFPGLNRTFKKVVHVGHSFGSAQTYSLVNMYPKISDGVILTGFSMNESFFGYFAAGANFVQATLNPTYGLKYHTGYLTSANINALQYLFFLPDYFNEAVLEVAEANKQPVTPGELLTLGSVPMTNAFTGPVLVITGSGDLPYCGGNCLATGSPSVPSIISGISKNFPQIKPYNFMAYIQPNTGHGLNFHYNSTGAYRVMNTFLDARVMKST